MLTPLAVCEKSLLLNSSLFNKRRSGLHGGERLGRVWLYFPSPQDHSRLAPASVFLVGLLSAENRAALAYAARARLPVPIFTLKWFCWVNQTDDLTSPAPPFTHL